MTEKSSKVRVIDSHTGGEPTRLVVAAVRTWARFACGAAGTFRSKHDSFRSAVVNEPRGSDVMVGALLCEPARSCVRRRRDLL